MSESILSTCDFVPVGDGTYRAVPRKPKDKLTPKEAARVTHYPLTTIYRLVRAGFIASERRSPRRLLIDAESLHAHLQAVSNGGFWTTERLARYRKEAI